MNEFTIRYILFVFIVGTLITLVSNPISGYGSSPQSGINFQNPQSINNQVKNSSQNFQLINVNAGQSQQNAIAPTTITSSYPSSCTADRIASGNCPPTQNTISNLPGGNIIPQNCVSSTQGLIQSIEVGVCNFNIAFHDAALSSYCFVVNNTHGLLNGISGNACKNPSLAANIANELIPTSPSIFDLGAGGFSQNISVQTGNNSLITFLDTPLAQAVAIAIVFLGLGWLAGTFGAGILANLMAKVGIALALYYYMNSEMSIFGSIPIFIYAFVNIIVIVPSIILLYQSFESVTV